MPPVSSVLTTPIAAIRFSLRWRISSRAPQPSGNASASSSAPAGPSRLALLSCISTSAGTTMVISSSSQGLGLAADPCGVAKRSSVRSTAAL
jgi:hypothetical protein